MTKKLLLAATAFTAIAFAGAAGAAEITAAEVSNVGLTIGGATPTTYTVANELVTGTAANRQTLTTAGANVITASVAGAGGRFVPGLTGTTYGAVLTLTGATFQGAVTDADLTIEGLVAGCTVTPTVVAGGATAGNTVTIAFTVPTSCSTSTAPTGISIDVPFTMAAAATTVSASVSFVTADDGAAFDGAADSVTLVRKAPIFDVSIEADGVATTLDLDGATPYTALITGTGFDNELGDITVAYATTPAGSAGANIYSNLAASTTRPTLTFDVAAQAQSGTFDNVTLSVGATALTQDADDASLAAADSLAAGTDIPVTVVVAPSTTSITTAQTYLITVTPELSAATVIAAPAEEAGVVQAITLEGTNFVAPWFTLNNPNNTAFLRLSNNGSTATGPVFLSLRSANGAASTAQIPLSSVTLADGSLASGGIPANGAVLVTGSAIAAAFGTSAQNGDLQVTIQADETNLTAKTRVRTASGVVTETSLGRLGESGSTF